MYVFVIESGSPAPALLGLGLSYGLTSDYTWPMFLSEDQIFHKTLEDIAKKLALKNNGENKFLRAIHVLIDIKAPLYWWKQMDQYKVATTTLSESTMHTITHEPFTLDMFETAYMSTDAKAILQETVNTLNRLRAAYLSIPKINTEARKPIWYDIISLLPSSFLQRRILSCSYATLQNIISQRKGHKLYEWQEFIDAILSQVPYIAFLTPPNNINQSE